MEEDFFTYLTAEIIINILSRLPIRTVAISKLVCKSWLHLLQTDDFVKPYSAKSVPSVAVMIERWNCLCKVLEFQDELDGDGHGVDFRYNQLTKFDFSHQVSIAGSANGLLLLTHRCRAKDTLYICNPITRQYVELRGPGEEHIDPIYPPWPAFGFGTCKISGQYKVVRISHKFECQVYTLGTGSWRRVVLEVEAARASSLELCPYYYSISSAVVDGRLYWMVAGKQSLYIMDNQLITCFDLETECFSSLRAPASHGVLSVMKDCLCFSEWRVDEIVMWLMKDYGVEECWRKEYVINGGRVCDFGYGNNVVYPTKVFENGDILLLWYGQTLVYYSNKTGTIKEIGTRNNIGEGYIITGSVLLTPSFLSLKGLLSDYVENVISF